MTYPSGNLTATVLSATTRAYEEKIRIWKEYANEMRAEKQVIFNHVPETCYWTLKKKYTGYVNITNLKIYNHLIEEYGEFLDEKIQENDTLTKKEITGETQFNYLVQQL